MNDRRSVNNAVLTQAYAAEAEIPVGPREHLVDHRLGQESPEHVADARAFEPLQPALVEAGPDPGLQQHRR